MANYAVTDWVSDALSADEVAAAIETYLETVDDTKTIVMTGIVPVGNDKAKAIIVHEA